MSSKHIDAILSEIDACLKDNSVERGTAARAANDPQFLGDESYPAFQARVLAEGVA